MIQETNKLANRRTFVFDGSRQVMSSRWPVFGILLVLLSSLSSECLAQAVPPPAPGPYGDDWDSRPPTLAECDKIEDLVMCFPAGASEIFVLNQMKASGLIFVSDNLTDPDGPGAAGLIPVRGKWGDHSPVDGTNETTCTRHGLPMILSADMSCGDIENEDQFIKTKEYWVNTLFHEARHIIQLGSEKNYKWILARNDGSADSVSRAVGRLYIAAALQVVWELEAHSRSLQLIEPAFFTSCDPDMVPNYMALVSDQARQNYRDLLKDDKKYFERYSVTLAESIARIEAWLAEQRGLPYSAEASDRIREVQMALDELTERLHKLERDHAKNLLLCAAIFRKDICKKKDQIDADKAAVQALIAAEMAKMPPEMPNQARLACLQDELSTLCEIVDFATMQMPDDPETEEEDESRDSNWKPKALAAYTNLSNCHGQLEGLATALEADCLALSAARRRRYLLENKEAVEEAPGPAEALAEAARMAKAEVPLPEPDADDEEKEEYRQLCENVEHAERVAAQALKDAEDVAQACEAIMAAEMLRWSEEQRTEIEEGIAAECDLILALEAYKDYLFEQGPAAPQGEYEATCADIADAQARKDAWEAQRALCLENDQAAEDASADGAVAKAYDAKYGVAPSEGEDRVGGSQSAYNDKRREMKDALKEVQEGEEEEDEGELPRILKFACEEASLAEEVREDAEDCEEE